MTKLRNKIVLVLLALCLVAFAGITVACGGDDNKSEKKPVTYTVTVKIDNEAVKGVKVTVKKGTVSYAPKTTGDDGKVEFSLAENSGYTVELTDLPDNYEVPADATLTFPADRNLTVNLAEKFAYKVKLVKENGDPFTMEGVTVGICKLSGVCLEGVEIDANGIARIEAEKDDYHIQILGLPAGYAYECDSHGYSVHQTDEGTYIYESDDNTYNSLSATVTEQEITIYQPNILDFDKMTALTDAELDDKYNDESRTITGAKAYKVQATVPAGETVYYTFNAEYSGKYTLYAVGFDMSTMGYKINPQFLLGENSAPNSSWDFRYYQGEGYLDATKGEQYYINVTAKDVQLELEFILTTPLASKDEISGAKTVNAAINKEGANAVIALTPTAGAAYKLTLQGTGAIAQAYSEEEATDYEFADADYAQNSECKVKFTEDMVGRTLYFAVSVKGDYPATVDVKVEKTADLVNTYNDVTTTDTLATYNRPDNKELVPVPLDGTAEELVMGQDGYYHYGTADGPVVMVVLTEALDDQRFGGGAVAYMEYYTNGWVMPYVIDVTPSEDVDDLTKGNTYDDYRVLLRGFKNYKSTTQILMIIPDPADIKVEKYYAKYVNEDGAYPLTEDLKDMLQLFADQILNSDNSLLLPDASDENVWMFACYYYDEVSEEQDAIVGEYKFVTKMEDGERISIGDQEEVDWDSEGNPIYKTYTVDTYKLVIEKGHKFAIYELNADEEYEEYDKGSWSKSEDGVYTFTVSVMDWDEDWNVIYTDLNFSATYSEQTGMLMLTADDGTEWGFTNKPELLEADEIVGNYDGDEYTLEVKGDGTFTFTDKMAGQVVNGTWEKNEDGATYTFIEDNPTFGETVYDVYVNEGNLEFFDDPDAFDPFYVFTPAGEEEEEYEEGDFANLDSTQTLPQDETIVQAKLGLWANGDCVLWQFSYRTQKYVKVATARWGANEAGTEVTITNVTVMEDYEFTITTDYNVDVELMAGVISITLHQGEGEEETTTPYTFYMLLQA